MKLPANNQSLTIAKTCISTPITLYRFFSGPCKALLIGGVHGDESEGFLLVERYIQNLKNEKLKLKKGVELYICPRLNPDGCENLRRTNHRNVDLNRNLPTKDWDASFKNVRYYPGPKANSEIESKLTVSLIKEIKPQVILSLHSYEKPMVNYNGPSEDLAKAMAKENLLEPKSDIGYPTPGSLGTYAGWERNIPTITLEILRGQAPEEVWEQHQKALTVGLEFFL